LGPYLGGNIGYAWGSVDNNPAKPSGFVGGVQGGYNWRLNPSWVFGVEGDIQAILKLWHLPGSCLPRRYRTTVGEGFFDPPY
jgi:opacity protein-like surface antigen